MPTDHNRRRTWRRRGILGTGATGIGLVAGCLGDDEVADDVPADDTDDPDDADDDDADDVDPADDDDQIVADDTDDEADDEPDEPAYHDVRASYVLGPPLPADSQYNTWGDGPYPWLSALHRYIGGFSVADNRFYGELAADFDYQPGVLEFSLHDDFYWWSGDNLTIEDYLLRLELENYVLGGEDLDAHESIITFDGVDDYTARLTLADTWRDSWAYRQAIDLQPIPESRAYLQPWVEQFEDAADLDAIEDLREELSSDNITSDEELIHHFHTPFEFRNDADGYGSVGEDYWDLEFVPEKNGSRRHLADETNFKYLRIYTREEREPSQLEFFQSEDQPHLREEIVRGIFEMDFDFPTRDFAFFRDIDQWSFQFNHEAHPGENVHFRRAWAYMTDATVWETAVLYPQQTFTPFMTDARAEQFVSGEILDSLTDYGYDESRPDEAEAELLEGGFEQDDDGNWLLQEDGLEGEAGEPIDLTVYTRGDWMEYIGADGTDFWLDLDDFGIDAEVVPEYPAADDWTVGAFYTGGGSPDLVYTSAFGPEDMGGWSHNPNFPGTVEAPSVGATAEAGDWDKDDWEEYDTATMADRLPVTTDTEMYQTLVDQLTWVSNQILPRFTVNGYSRAGTFNDNRWRWVDEEEQPEKYLRLPVYQYSSAAFRYVPEEDR